MCISLRWQTNSCQVPHSLGEGLRTRCVVVREGMTGIGSPATVQIACRACLANVIRSLLVEKTGRRPPAKPLRFVEPPVVAWTLLLEAMLVPTPPGLRQVVVRLFQAPASTQFTHLRKFRFSCKCPRAMPSWVPLFRPLQSNVHSVLRGSPRVRLAYILRLVVGAVGGTFLEGRFPLKFPRERERKRDPGVRKRMSSCGTRSATGSSLEPRGESWLCS